MRKTVFFLSACAGSTLASDALFNQAWGFSSQNSDQTVQSSTVKVYNYLPVKPVTTSTQSLLPVQEIKQVVKAAAQNVYNQPQQEYIVGKPDSLFSTWSGAQKTNYLPVKTVSDTSSYSWVQSAKSFFTTTTTKATTTTTQAPVYKAFPQPTEKQTFQTTYYKPFFNWNEPVFNPVRIGYSAPVQPVIPVSPVVRKPLVWTTESL